MADEKSEDLTSAREDDEWAWLVAFARALKERSPSREEIGSMLRLSRNVARGVERKMAPLSSFVAGMHVGRRTAEGADPREALREVLDAAAGLVPDPPPDEPA
jgi:Domain of unknown function (DUF6457)